MLNIQTGDELLLVLEALSNPYRLKIITILQQEKEYVSQLARTLGISRPLLYLHLQKLEDAKLVKSHYEISNDGKTTKFYELNDFNFSINSEVISALSNSLTMKKRKEP